MIKVRMAADTLIHVAAPDTPRMGQGLKKGQKEHGPRRGILSYEKSMGRVPLAGRSSQIPLENR